MNTPNNKRKKESIRRIEKVFIDLLQTKKLNEIRVSDICKEAKINRTTFYANYTDIYGLADTIRAVSYTHLDVYKRQGVVRGRYCCLCIGKQGRDRGGLRQVSGCGTVSFAGGVYH